MTPCNEADSHMLKEKDDGAICADRAPDGRATSGNDSGEGLLSVVRVDERGVGVGGSLGDNAGPDEGRTDGDLCADEFDDLDDRDDFDCTYCGGDGYCEVDDPLWDDCDEWGWGECSACGGTGLRKHQTVF